MAETSDVIGSRHALEHFDAPTAGDLFMLPRPDFIEERRSQGTLYYTWVFVSYCRKLVKGR